MVKTRSAAPEGQDFIISSLPPSPAQRRLALAVVLALIAAFVVTAPLSAVPLARIDAFIPMYAAAMLMTVELRMSIEHSEKAAERQYSRKPRVQLMPRPVSAAAKLKR